MLEDPQISSTDPSLIPSDTMDDWFEATFEVIEKFHQSDEHSTKTGSLQKTLDPVELFWYLDSQYWPGTVSYINPAGHYKSKYDDGEV